MGQEIERKYLIDHDKWAAFVKSPGQLYEQGYLLTDPDRTIRVRLAGSQGFLTIKGLPVGATRTEFEYPIPVADAKELLDHFAVTKLRKTRYKITQHSKVWEIDEFLDENSGLIVAEIELENEQESFALPDWVDREVTGDERYYNANLTLNPYKNWKT